MLARLYRTINRKVTKVHFDDKTRTTPISANFGWDRGTPVDRHYIESFLRQNAQLITGRVLEIADSSYSRRFAAGGVESFNVLHVTDDNEEATIVGDLSDCSTLPEGAFDCFICAQTFQYIFEVASAVQGAYHLLKPGGVLLATVPGISQISRKDADSYGEFWRFTTDSMRRLLHPVFGADVAVQSFGNVMSATALLQGCAIEDLPDRSFLDACDPSYQVIVSAAARKKG